MSEMIEKVALAIYGEVALKGVGDDVRKTMMGVARAAVEAMREPTQAMQAAGEAAGGKAYEWTGDSIVFHAANSWPAMIDAALQDETP